LIGLIAGISVLSFVEFLYHFAAYFFTFLSPKRIIIQVQPFNQEKRQKKVTVNQEHALYHFSKYFTEYIKKSSIHGLVYTTKKDRKVVERIFWTIIVIISTIVCGFLIAENLNHSELNPIVFEIDEKVWNLEEVVIVCLLLFEILIFEF
jgi:Amiloride-sensitive sodium channel